MNHNTAVVENDPTFPWKRTYYTWLDVLKCFNKLKSYRFNFIHCGYAIYNLPWLSIHDKHYQSIPTLILQGANDYEEYGNWMSDYFNEEERLKAKRYDKPCSPIEYWNRHIPELYAYAWSHYKSYSKKSLRDALFYKFYGEVTQFRPTLMAGAIELFGSKRVLDFCSGWGDRLLGALAKDVDLYVGIDPNTKLHEGYKKMIELLRRRPETEFTMIDSPFEDVDLGTYQFDLIMTSPPFFDLEVYVDKDQDTLCKQSTTRYPTHQQWLNKFLLPCVRKAWNHLSPNGRMIIYINDNRDRPDQPIVAPLLKYLQDNVRDAAYEGILPCTEYNVVGKLRSPKPMFVWQKRL